jgi:Tol biopolymer transport system component/predicted Ser/Thr protein kinase
LLRGLNSCGQRQLEECFQNVTGFVRIGVQISHYQILALLGAGGMGEVYKARDTRLDRAVAVKVLPRDLAEDPERRMRFEREARVVSQLNHPHVCALYDIGNEKGVNYIVMELVEGETLAERIARQPIPLQQALPLFDQIADALQAAHEKGIIHRDLKPANIKITPAGKIKVLDFGLAKAFSKDSGPSDLSKLPTARVYETGTGMILGTAAYMSPEQARGRTLDQRTDIWAFGCCLYQALTGKAPFQGETMPDTIAAILDRQPDWEALPSKTQTGVRSLLYGCLHKDPGLRPQQMSHVRTEIEKAMAGLPAVRDVLKQVATWPIWRDRIVWALPALLLLAGGIGAYLRWAREAPMPRLVNPVQVSAAIGVEDYPTWSPDGRTLAYGSNETGNWDIWVKQPGGGPAVNRTTDFSGDDLYPSWSPDGRQIAFWSDRDGGGYYLMSALGGGLQRVASNPHTGSFFHSPPDWSADGSELAYVIYETAGSQLEAWLEIVSLVSRQTRRIRLPGNGTTRLDLQRSSDGRYVAYLDSGSQYGETTQLLVASLSAATSVSITDGRSNVRSPRWSPDGQYIYFVSNQGGTADVWRQRMQNGKPEDDPQRITTAVGVSHIAFSRDGKRIAYSQGRAVANVWRVPVRQNSERRPATWADAEQMTFDQAFIEFVDVSRDGQTLAFSSDRSGNQDIWVLPIGASGQMRQLTFNVEPDWDPDWSPDGRTVAFYSFRTADREIWTIPAAGGQAIQLTRSAGLDATPEWSPDGREIAFRSERTGNSDIWIIPAGGGEERQITTASGYDISPSWSPDGRYLAFTTRTPEGSQIHRVHVQQRHSELLSSGPVATSQWSPDGNLIYFVGADERAGNLWALSLKDRRVFAVTNLSGRRGSLGFQPPSTDGKYLYFPWRDDVSDVWIMDVVQE